MKKHNNKFFIVILLNQFSYLYTKVMNHILMNFMKNKSINITPLLLHHYYFIINSRIIGKRICRTTQNRTERKDPFKQILIIFSTF